MPSLVFHLHYQKYSPLNLRWWPSGSPIGRIAPIAPIDIPMATGPHPPDRLTHCQEVANYRQLSTNLASQSIAIESPPSRGSLPWNQNPQFNRFLIVGARLFLLFG
jgi:hypothetical protein